MTSWLRLIDLLLVVLCALGGTNAAVHDRGDFVAPGVKLPDKSSRHAIMPFSLYKRRLEERQRLESERDRDSTTTTTTQQPDDPQQPVILYLPAFRNANRAQISDLNPEDVHSQTVDRQSGANSTDSSSAERTISHALDGTSQEKPSYSTSNSRQPLPYHKSIFRPRTNQIVTNTEQRFLPRANANTASVQPNPNVEDGSVPERPIVSPVHPQPPNSFFGTPLESIQPPAVVRAEPTRAVGAYQPQPVYSNILPAPHNALSSNASPNNLVDSIFSQSQLRHAPPHPPAVGLLPQAAAAQPINPLQALTQSAGGLGGGGQEMLNPLQLLGGGGGSPLETISKLARNLLSLPAGNPELFSAMTKALSSGAAAEGAKLTSNAVIQPASALAASEAAEKIAPAIAAETLISSARDEDNANSSLKLLSILPEEQRTLLAAAIQNGELDGATLAPTLSSLLEAKDKGVLRSENKLMEWIQQNRPRAAEREALEGANVIAADKLPYYGRYCGSFGTQNSTKHFNVVGALWAVDERRLIVSKFHFKPGSSSENVTFWAGPANITGNQADMFPSENGFYLRPEPIDLNVFLASKVEVVPAKVTPISRKIEKDATNGTAAEIEELEEEGAETGGRNLSANDLRRVKRGSIPLHFAAVANESDQSVNLKLTTKTGASPSTTTAASTTTTTTEKPTPKPEISFGHEANFNRHSASSSNEMVPLDWYAGFQPLLLTLPEGRSVQQLHWVSIFDHKRKESTAVVWIPNGVAFRVPTAVQFRPLTPNGAHKLSSGPVKVLDTKTIQIENFNLETSPEMPVWFLVGKEIVPHAEGQIVPVFDRTNQEFDCDSLRDYQNETVTLRLPGSMDIKDVFWFSVFSITKSVSLSQLYLPYNDLQCPPDLLGIATPRCVWNPK